jgi:hypothetical protein
MGGATALIQTAAGGLVPLKTTDFLRMIDLPGPKAIIGNSVTTRTNADPTKMKTDIPPEITTPKFVGARLTPQ